MPKPLLVLLKIHALLLFFSICASNTQFANAQTILDVSLQVGDTTITLSGKTSPSATVTISEDNAIVGTTTADSLGNYTKTLDSQTAGLHEFAIYSTDNNSTATSVTTVSLSATAFENTSVSNIILPPTIYITATQVDQGDPITLSGYGVPNSTVQVYISTITGFLTTSSDSNGFWTYTIDTTDFEGGEHTVYAKVVTISSNTSLASTQATISINEPDSDSDRDDDDDNYRDDSSNDNQTITTNITNFIKQGLNTSDTNNLLLTALAYFDIDNSGKIEMSELELAIRRWLLETKGKGNGRCDLNFDGKCDIIDFSILLYYIDR